MGKNDREVVPNSDGGWDVKKPGHPELVRTRIPKPMRSLAVERSFTTLVR